ncbi:GNAT family N-acetyltransferase [Palleronia caenipelagi]|uniref:GNAT family N-acetyltransferase n=1 Tax=Palleronia caenipelagi TaxID=2489174 RepID=A0A547QAY0_9RHOB|nr:GNAT family N-acetyltransferase [Palleronia caenipelagi]
MADLSGLGWLFQSAVIEGASPKYTARQLRAWAGQRQPPSWLSSTLRSGRTRIAGPKLRGFLTARTDGYLALFFVYPSERGGPVAPALYNDCARWCERSGVPQMSAHASHLLRPFLERRGWTTVRTECVLRRGQRIERFFMLSRTRAVPTSAAPRDSILKGCETDRSARDPLSHRISERLE